MIPVLTAQEMKKLDQDTIDGDLNIGFSLMQQASRSLFDVVISKYLDIQKQNKQAEITILCGKGNNGGDGILLASQLVEEGYPVKVFLLASPDQLQGEAKLAYEKLVNHPVIIFIINTTDVTHLAKHLEQVHKEKKHHFIIDALIGIGANRATEDPYKTVLEIVQGFQTQKTIIAVDCPSATNSSTGEILSQPIKADLTVTMGYPKLASFFYPARAFYGVTIVASLNYPKDKIEELDCKKFFITDIKNLLPGRIINGSKFDHGVASIIAGSLGMTGAASFCVNACYRAGIGLVNLFSSQAKQISPSCPEAIYFELAEKTNDDLLNIKEKSAKANLLTIGPGLSLKHKELVHEIIKKTNRPLILDADALNSIEGNTKLLKESNSEILITPHLGEFKRLFGDELNSGTKAEELVDVVSQRAQEFGITILLKGAPTLIALPDSRVFILPYGNSALATAGTGDILTGLITGIASQLLKRPESLSYGLNSLSQAGIAASFIHGKAGEQASKDLSEYSVVASDLLKYIPLVFKNL